MAGRQHKAARGCAGPIGAAGAQRLQTIRAAGPAGPTRPGGFPASAMARAKLPPPRISVGFSMNSFANIPRLVAVFVVVVAGLAPPQLQAADAGASPPPPRPAHLARQADPDLPDRAVTAVQAALARGTPGAEPASAPETVPAAPAATGIAAPSRGPVTGLPLPRFVSMKAGEGNARRGPGTTHRVDWVFRHRDMPLMVTAEFEHWRRVQDADGAGGWMHFALLSGVRTVLVQAEMTALHVQPDPRAPVVAYLERGVVARVRQCRPEWCRLTVEGRRGWAQRSGLWGVFAHETID